jgi:hypothetical protein
MALNLIQPLTEMSTRNISWGQRRPVRRADKPYHLYVPIVLKSKSLNFLEHSGPLQTCNGIALLIYLSLIRNKEPCKCKVPLYMPWIYISISLHAISVSLTISPCPIRTYLWVITRSPHGFQLMHFKYERLWMQTYNKFY